MNVHKPIPFCTFGGYVRFSRFWWTDLLRYVTGIAVYRVLWEPYITTPGWCSDVYTYWHRARYGWAPRDVWNLDLYLGRTLAATLEQLADASFGCPAGYFDAENTDDECHRWKAAVRGWSHAFAEDPRAVELPEHDSAAGFKRYRAEVKRREKNRRTALKELATVWSNLWN
jgi:hypothetical protein